MPNEPSITFFVQNLTTFIGSKQFTLVLSIDLMEKKLK